MNIFLYFSNMIIPLLIFYVVMHGVLQKIPVYDVFVEGAKDGLKTVVEILPTLIGLMVAVGVLRASGFLDFLSSILKAPCEAIGFPADLIPMTLIRMFSSSAATGLVLDIFRTYGTDSLIGKIASISMSCTETIFYTMSVYFMAAKVTKTRYTLPGALLTTFVGVAASVVLAYMI